MVKITEKKEQKLSVLKKLEMANKRPRKPKFPVGTFVTQVQSVDVVKKTFKKGQVDESKGEVLTVVLSDGTHEHLMRFDAMDYNYFKKEKKDSDALEFDVIAPFVKFSNIIEKFDIELTEKDITFKGFSEILKKDTVVVLELIVDENPLNEKRYLLENVYDISELEN